MESIDPGLEAAKAKLATLRDRDAILDLFFEHASTLFRFCVLFVVRDDRTEPGRTDPGRTAQGRVALGRNVNGLGAPRELVARLAIPLAGGGVLGQAADLKRAIVVSPAADGADAMLIGTLGRAMPSAVVAPVIVRGRVVALLLGEGGNEAVRLAAEQRGASPAEVLRDVIAQWATSAGDAFETLIIARKSEDGSIAPAVASLRRPVPFRDSGPPSITSTRREQGQRTAIFVGAAVVGAALVVGGAAWLMRGESGPSLAAVPGERVAGWPAAVDPIAAIDQAREASGLGDRAELLGLRGTMKKGGVIDVSPGAAGERSVLHLTLGAADSEVEVEVDAAGMKGVRRSTRAMCDGRPCRSAVAAPRSTLAQLWEAATALGARDDDRLVLSYKEGDAGPEWSISAEGRGVLRLADGTAKPLNRDRIRPPALPLASVPGAPKVDPLEALAPARVQSGFGAHAAVLEIDARGVGADGRVDLSEATRSITYRLSEAESVPTVERRWRQVKLTSEGMPLTSSATDHDALPALVKGPVDLPRCTFAEAWARGGLPADATVRLIYRAEKSVPEAGEWTLDAPTMSTQITFTDRQCAIAAGKVKE